MNITSFEKTIQSDKKLLLVEFWASWAGGSQLVAPIMSKVREQFMHVIDFEKIDFDESATVVIHYKLQTVPSLLFFEAGKLVERIQGVFSHECLVQKIEYLILSKEPKLVLIKNSSEDTPAVPTPP